MRSIPLIEFCILAVIIGIPGAILQYFLYKRDRKKLRQSSLWLTWTAFQNELIQTLHHPHPDAQEMDRLLEKLQTFTASGLSSISDEDRGKLIQLLNEKLADDNAAESDRIGSRYLLITMPKVRRKQEAGLK